MTQLLSTLPSNSATPLRVLLYSRVSSPRQAQAGHSIKSQPENLTAYAQAQGWRVVGEFSDPGRTGRNADREGFTNLLETIRTLRPDAVVVTRLSRFMRNARLTLNAVYEMRELGVALICKDEPIDTRQRGIGDMFLAILATMAEWESDRLSEYSRDTRQMLISKGRWPAGKPPYGYRSDKNSGELVVVPDQAEVVRLIFSLYTENRMGMASISRELRNRVIPAPGGGNVWGRATVRQVLANSAYAGQHLLGMPVHAIITPEIFGRAQQLRASNKKLHPPRKNQWPLQNRLRCILCGSTFKCTHSHGRRVYRCPGGETTSRNYLETGKKCTMQGHHADIVEEQLSFALGQALDSPEAFAKALEVSISDLRTRAKDLERDIAPLRDALDEVEQELQRINLSWIRGRIPDDQLQLLEKSALERKEHIQAQLEASDPDNFDELDRTICFLRVAEEALGSLQNGQAQGGIPPSIIFGFQNGWSPPLPPDWPPTEFVSYDDDEKRTYDTMPDVSPKWARSTLEALLNKLQAEVWASPDCLEIRGLVSMNLPTSPDQAFSSPTKI